MNTETRLEQEKMGIVTMQKLGNEIFPHITLSNQSRTLVRWIKGDPELMEELRKAGFRIHRQRCLTPRQAEIIRYYFYG